MSWTINYTSLSDLDVESLVFQLQNQEDDYVEVKFPSNFDSAFPDMFQQDSSIVVRHGGSVVFRGTVDSLSTVGSHSSEAKSVFAFGPWHRFRQDPFLCAYNYVGGSQETTHGIIGGSANQVVQSILSRVTSYITIGTIDLGNMVLPETEVYDYTIAQALQAVLRLVPGAVVLFDYSTLKPTVHVLADNSSTLRTVTVDAASGTCQNLQVVPRYDRKVDGVYLWYEGGRSIKDGVFALRQDGYGQDENTISSPVGVTGHYIVAVDNVGDFSSRRVLRRTIRLSGAYEQTTYTLHGQLFNRTLGQAISGGSAGVSGPNVDLCVWLSFFRLFASPSSLNCNYDADFTYYLQSPSLKGYVSANTSNNSTYKPLIRIGEDFNSFIAGGVVKSLQKNPGIQIGSIPQVFFDSPGISTQLATLTWNNFYQFQYPVGEHTITADNVLFVNPSNFSNGVFTKTVSTNNISTPSGVAAQYLSANSRLLHDGRLSLSLVESPTTFFGLYRRISIQPLGVTAPIQRLTFDTSTDTADITFGAPNHLGPQDYISLLRAGTA